jgi:enoyl-CoA hydratase
LGLVNRVVPRAQLETETMQLAKRIALQDPFALRIAKFSMNQMQDEMGFRTGITNAFQNYALTRVYRLTQGEDTMSGAERARRRDEVFGDNT